MIEPVIFYGLFYVIEKTLKVFKNLQGLDKFYFTALGDEVKPFAIIILIIYNPF